MTSAEFEARIVGWANARRDVEALVQIGSRAQPAAEVDAWSDWDYHLVVRDARPYANPAWAAEIAPAWCVHVERTERAVTKLSGVFAGGWEADFVPLTAWQMRLVCWAMRRPGWRRLFPRPLRQGIANLRLIAGPGYRVVLGGPAWERRYAAVRGPWPDPVLGADQFRQCQAAFWRHAVWVFKKSARGELRAAARWHGREVLELVYLLLAEEARLGGRRARPEARKAERWLEPERLRQTELAPGWSRAEQARAQLATIDVFSAAARAVAAGRGFALEPHAEIERWLRAELGRMAAGS